MEPTGENKQIYRNCLHVIPICPHCIFRSRRRTPEIQTPPRSQDRTVGMRLYRIRNKQTGKFFAYWVAPWSTRHAGKSCWNDRGTFFRTIDTCAKHIKWTCSDWHPDPSTYRAKPIVTKYYPKRLKNYEVVVNDVTINGEEIIQAAKLLKRRKK